MDQTTRCHIRGDSNSLLSRHCESLKSKKKDAFVHFLETAKNVRRCFTVIWHCYESFSYEEVQLHFRLHDTSGYSVRPWEQCLLQDIPRDLEFQRYLIRISTYTMTNLNGMNLHANAGTVLKKKQKTKPERPSKSLSLVLNFP